MTSKAGLEVYDDNGDRMLIITKSHLAKIIAEWNVRAHTELGEVIDYDNEAYGVYGAEAVFELAKEMGYVSY